MSKTSSILTVPQWRCCWHRLAPSDSPHAFAPPIGVPPCILFGNFPLKTKETNSPSVLPIIFTLRALSPPSLRCMGTSDGLKSTRKYRHSSHCLFHSFAWSLQPSGSCWNETTGPEAPGRDNIYRIIPKKVGVDTKFCSYRKKKGPFWGQFLKIRHEFYRIYKSPKITL